MVSSIPYQLCHPIIGNIRGKRSGDALQFLGVQYATLSHWFDNAQLVLYDGSGLIADHYCPQAIFPPSAVDMEHGIIQKAIPKPEFPGMSGTDCLNLNITTPSENNSSHRLPVVVFIHGGGFAIGANWWPQYDMRRVVELSARLGKPIIGVNINYRLGAPGFLTSQALRNAGYKPNNGHNDQRTALLWLKKYISGFGGDPNKITIVGESAGGLSASRLVNSKEPLASRLVVLGGAPPSSKPIAPEVAEAMYLQILEALGIPGLPVSKQIEALSKVSPEDLLAKIGRTVLMGPTLDGDLIPVVPNFNLMSTGNLFPSNTWCSALMVGHCTMDATIFATMGLLQRMEGVGAAFSKHINASLSQYPVLVNELLEVYGIASEKSNDESFAGILKLASDIAFREPARQFAKSFGGDTFVLEFAEPNPWDGPFQGLSTHVLDVAFLFQNYLEFLDDEQKASAITFAEDVIKFANGIDPWSKFKSGNEVAIYKNGRTEEAGVSTMRAAQIDVLSRLTSSAGLDSVLEAWETFLFHS